MTFKKIKLALTTSLLTLLVGCGGSDDTASTNFLERSELSWEAIGSEAKGTTVNIYMWGGAKHTNDFVDDYLRSELKKANDITLNRVPVSDIKDTVNKLATEKLAGKKSGNIDIIWLNGENFKNLKDNELLLGEIAPLLPNTVLLKEESLKSDFGEPINGLEIPWGETQFAFVYDSSRGNVPFYDAASLLEYAKDNPGRFTYPAPPDFTGSAFVRNMVIDILGEDAYKMTLDEFEIALDVVWDYFNELEPYLWREGKTYPESPGKLRLLFKNDIVDVFMDYEPNVAAQQILLGEMPDTIRPFFLEKGTLFNNNYLTIPFNSGNPSGALYTINFMISELAQLELKKPQYGGLLLTPLDITKLPKETQVAFEKLSINKDLPDGVVPKVEELDKKRQPELPKEKLELIESGWAENVL